MGSPEGLYVHCPACDIPGIGVSVELNIFGSLFSAGMGLLVYAHPVMAPSVFPVLSSMDNGVNVKLWITESFNPG